MKILVAPVLAGLIFCIGCAGHTVPPDPLLKLPADPAAYLADVRAQTGSVNDVSGFAKLRIVADQKTTNSRNIFFVKRSGRIRIETLGFLSRPALFFTADPFRIQLYAVDSNSFFTGVTSGENFSRVIGMPLELDGIVESFLGQPTLRDCPDKRITTAEEQGQFVFTVACGIYSEKIHIDPGNRRITRYVLFENGAPVYAYNYSQFRAFDSIIFPLKIEIYHYNYKAAVTLNFESLSFEDIPVERFEIIPPQNLQVHSLEELGAAP
jgi:hypothetical protein